MSSPRFAAGAVDLSALKQRAQQPTTQPGAPAGRAGAGSYVVEVTEQTFEAETIRRSMQHPVVLELYSPRVSTGQQLSDTLAELAAQYAGSFLLARLNVGTAPGIVQALQLQAVPTVIALINGQLAPLFQGVQARAEVAAAIDQVIKAAVSSGLVGRAEPVGGAASADESAEDVPDPRFDAADAALEAGDFAGAVVEFDKLLAANPNDAEAAAGKAQASLLARASALDPTATLAAAASPGATVEDHVAAADVEMAMGAPQDAFARLIGQVKVRAGDERNAARIRLLELFEILGNTDERVLKARRDLMTALF